MVVNEGLDHILGVVFSDDTVSGTMYMGLKGAGAVAAADTMASHAGWSEITDYSGNRKAWVEGGVSSQSIDNSGSPATFNITGSVTVAGAFLTEGETGTGEKLMCAVDFSASRSLSNGDTLNVTYTLTAADDGV